MNLEIQIKRAWDYVNSQPPVVRIILLFAIFLFIVIPFAIPVAIGYFLWTFIHTKKG